MTNTKAISAIRGSEQLGGPVAGVARHAVGFRDVFFSNRFQALLLFTLILTCVGTFRSFGFDLDETITNYPDVADGWGLWFWLGQWGLNFPVFFFIVNLILASTIAALTFPSIKKGHSAYRLVQLTVLLYMTFWFLFGQARYGTAIGLVVCAMSSESLLIALALCGLSILVHKAMIGGVILLFLWRGLVRFKYGLLAATLICGAVTYLVVRMAGELLQLAGYGNYLNWELLPSPNTPYKYLYFVLLFLVFLWRAKDKDARAAAKEMLVLTLLFFPFSLYLAFAGRAYQLFAVVVLAYLTHKSIPYMLRYLILSVYFFDLYLLVFRGGCFAPSGCMGP